MTKQELKNLTTENLAHLRCNECEAETTELNQDDLDLLNELKCCPMCNADLENLTAQTWAC